MRARAICALLAAALVLPAWPSVAQAAAVDGISDQDLPVWEGSFAASALAANVADTLARGQLRYARYVLQWDAAAQPSAGADAHGDYRERYEAWLADVRALGLTPVLALTSYDGVRPPTTSAYAAALARSLALARRAGASVADVEAWNEPNNQGRLGARAAAALADAAQTVCATSACTVIAGDFEDAPGLAAYERAYVGALAFAPSAWGVHPYRSLATRDDAQLRTFVAGLPGHGRGAQVWFTEIGAFACRFGVELGAAAQAAEADYLVHTLIRDPAVAPAHVLYYGVMAGDGSPAPCTRAGGEDSELYGPEGAPRPAAGVVFGAGSPLLGPVPGQEALAFAALAR